MQTMSLTEFAAAVQGLVNATPESQRWGSRKVWIKDIARSATMRARLVEAHRAGLIELTRADLAISGDERAKAAKSEVRYMNAEWHLITVR